MKTKTLALADFLLARIAEDEAAARGVYSHSIYWRTTTGGHEFGPNLAYFEEPDDAVHVARWSPDRVLAECAARRKIVATARDYSPELEHGDNGEWAFDLVLWELAQPYSDHPDFDRRWRP